MIKAIIFDCFGLVLPEAADEAYRSLGGDPEKDRAFIREAHYASHSGKIPSSAPVLAARLGVSEGEWIQAIRSQEGDIDTGLLAYVQDLRKNRSVGMLSNISKGGLSRFFEPGFLEQYFDVVIESGDIGFAKPEARAYEIAAEKLSVRLDECVFVDDRQEYLDGAQAVGMQTILYEDFEDFKTQLEKLLI